MRIKKRGRAIYCSACGKPTKTDPCSKACRTELDQHDEMREAK